MRYGAHERTWEGVLRRGPTGVEADPPRMGDLRAGPYSYVPFWDSLNAAKNSLQSSQMATIPSKPRLNLQFESAWKNGRTRSRGPRQPEDR